MYKQDLEEVIKSETGGDFAQALLALLKATRDESVYVDDDRARRDATVTKPLCLQSLVEHGYGRVFVGVCGVFSNRRVCICVPGSVRSGGERQRNERVGLPRHPDQQEWPPAVHR